MIAERGGLRKQRVRRAPHALALKIGAQGSRVHAGVTTPKSLLVESLDDALAQSEAVHQIRVNFTAIYLGCEATAFPPSLDRRLWLEHRRRRISPKSLNLHLLDPFGDNGFSRVRHMFDQGNSFVHSRK